MKILLVNDDGIEAPGIKALIDTLSREHELFVIAPNGQRSGFSICGRFVWKNVNCKATNP